MNSIPYRDFAVIGRPAHDGRATGQPRRGLIRRVLDAIAESHQRAAEREITRYLTSRLGSPAGKLTDEIERSAFERLNDHGGFRS